MTTGISVSGANGKEHIAGVSDAIEKIFDSGFKNHIEQSTIVSALQVLGEASKVENVSISGNSVQMSPLNQERRSYL